MCKHIHLVANSRKDENTKTNVQAETGKLFNLINNFDVYDKIMRITLFILYHRMQIRMKLIFR